MIIIGEKINSSIPSVKELIGGKDEKGILKLAADQCASGASFIDINAGMFLKEEPAYLAFLAKTISGGLSLPLSIDTPSVEAARAALEAVGTGGHIINSVTIEPQRLDGMTALASEYGCGVVALCSPKPGDEDTPDMYIDIAGQLVSHLTSNGIAQSDIYIDPMLKPVGAAPDAGVQAIDRIAKIHCEFPDCHITCGLSNLSFGLPKRRILNRAFMACAIYAGLDAAIADAFDKDLMGIAAAAEVISGRDEYCMEYIEKCRGGKI